MADNINIKMKLDGEADFRRAISACNSELKNMNSALKLVDAETKGQANTMESLSKKVEALGKAHESAKSKVQTLSEIVEKSKKAQTDAAKAVENAKKAHGEDSAEVAKAVQAYQNATNRVNKWETQLNTATAQEKQLDSELQKNKGYLEEAKNSTDGTAKSIDEFGKEVKDTSDATSDFNKVVGNTAAMEAITRIAETASSAIGKLGESAYSSAKELDVGYDTIIKKTGATGEALTGLNKVADNIFSTMPVEMADVGAAVGEINTRFGATDERLQGLSEQFLKFANINDMDVNTAVTDVIQSMKMFNVESDETENVLGLITSQAQKTGISVGTLTSALKTSGPSLKEMGLGLTESVNLLASFEASGIDSSQMLTGLKKAAADCAKNGVDMNEWLQDVVKRMQDSETEADATSEIFEKFGTRAGGAFVDAARDGKISLDGLSEDISKYGKLVDETFENTLDGWDKATVASNNLKTAGSELTKSFFEAAAPAMDVASKALKGFADGIKNAPQPVKNLVGVMGGLVTVGAKIAPVVTPVITGLKQLKVARESMEAIKGLNAAVAATKAPMAAAAVAEAASATAAGADATAKVGETVATEGATVAQHGLNAAMLANPIGLLIAGIAALVGGLAVYAANADGAKSETQKLKDELDEFADKCEETKGEIDSVMESAATSVGDAESKAKMAGEYADELTKLADKSALTAEEQAKMRQLVGELNSLYPDMGLEIDSVTGKLNKSSEEIKKYVANLANMARAEAYNRAAAESFDELVKAETEYGKGIKNAAAAETNLANVQAKITAINEQNAARQKEYAKTQDELNKAYQAGATNTGELEAKLMELSNDYVTIDGQTLSYSDALTRANDELDSAQEVYDGYIDELADAKTSMDELKSTADGYIETANGIKYATDEESAAVQSAAEAEAAAAEARKASISVAGEELTAWNNLDEGMQTAAANMATSVQSMIDSIGNYSQSVGDWFSEVEKASDQSYTKMVDNFAGQIKAMQDWESNLAKLAESGIEDGLLQYLAEMGPQGAGYVQAMVEQLNSNSESGIGQLNELWKQKLRLEEGINYDGEKVIKAVGELGAGGADKFKEISNTLNASASDTGKGAVRAMVEGIQSAQEQARQAAEQVGEYASSGMAQGILNGKSGVVNAAVEVAGAAETGAKKRLDMNSPSKKFITIGKNIVAGLVKGVKKEKNNAKKSASELALLYVSAAKEKISYLDSVDQLNVEKEEAIWRALLKKTKKGTKAYQQAYAELYKVQKEIKTKKNELAADYKQGWQEVKTNLVADIQEVTKAYDEAVKSRKNALTDSMSLFDYFKSATLETPSMLISKLQTQVDGLKRFDTALDKLAKNASVPKELIEQLQEMGPQETANIELIASMNKKELAEYVKLWKEKNAVAEDRAKQENEQLLKDSEKQVKALIQQANKDLTALEKEYNKDLKAIGATAKDQSKTIGKNIVKGITAGINSENAELTKTLKNLCKKITNTTKDALKIKSPSRVFRDEIGKYLALGLTEGFDKNLKPLDFSPLTQNVPDIQTMFGQMKADFGNFSVETKPPIVQVYLGDKELSAVLSSSVIKNISGGVRAYAAAGGR